MKNPKADKAAPKKAAVKAAAPKADKPVAKPVDQIIKGVRKLKKPDFKPTIQLSDGSHYGRHHLVVTREGVAENLPISPRLVEELIAAGYEHGAPPAA